MNFTEAGWFASAGADVLPPIGEDVYALIEVQGKEKSLPLVMRGESAIHNGKVVLLTNETMRDELPPNWKVVAWRLA